MMPAPLQWVEHEPPALRLGDIDILPPDDRVVSRDSLDLFVSLVAHILTRAAASRVQPDPAAPTSEASR